MSQENETEGKETWDRSLKNQMWRWEKTRPLTLKRALAQVDHIRKNPLKARAKRMAERNLHFVVLAYRTIVDEKENEKNRWIFDLVRQYYGVPEGQSIPAEVKRKLKDSYQYALRRIRELELKKPKTGQGMGHYHDLNEFQKHNALIDEVKRKAKARSD